MAGDLVVIAVVVLVALAVAGVALYLRAKRIKELEAFAVEHGWAFERDDSRGRPGQYHGFVPFGVGDSRRAGPCIAGALRGHAFDLFEYAYSTGSGKNRQRHHHVVCALAMPVEGRGLSIQDEHLGHKLWDAVGGEDIDFESDEFSRRFWVKGADRRFAYDVVHAGMIEYLLPTEGWHWQWKGRTLVLTRRGTLRTRDCLPLLELAAGFRERLPAHLLV